MVLLQGMIQYGDGSDCYLKLNDNDAEAYKLEMSKSLPIKGDPHREKCKFMTIFLIGR
jgi:hypothetical protein